MKSRLPFTDRADACYALLQSLARGGMPAIRSEPDDIHMILALRSAALLDADVEPVAIARNGQRSISRATVTRITAKGRALCMLRDAARPVAPRR
jgi:hypothetical protein